MKLKKTKKRLETRIASYEKSCQNSNTGGKEFKKPGSMNGKK